MRSKASTSHALYLIALFSQHYNQFNYAEYTQHHDHKTDSRKNQIFKKLYLPGNNIPDGQAEVQDRNQKIGNNKNDQYDDSQ